MKRSADTQTAPLSGAGALLGCMVTAFFVYKIIVLWAGPVITEIRLKDNGKEVIGTVTRAYSTKYYSSRGRGGYGHWAWASYMDVDYRVGSKRFRNKNCQEGDTVTITCLPSNPDIAMATRPRQSVLAIIGLTSISGIGILCCFLFTLALALGVFYLFLYFLCFRMGIRIPTIIKVTPPSPRGRG
jgi:hypothetical protein